MKTGNNKIVVIGILIGILAMMSFVQNAEAFRLWFSDDVWFELSVEGPSLTKPGNTETYTVSGTLWGVGYAKDPKTTTKVHIKFWVVTYSQAYKVLLEEDALPYGTYPAGHNFTKTYQISIPTDAVNNGIVWAKLDTSTTNFSDFCVSLIQDPTYSELESQIKNLQYQLENIRTAVTSLLIIAITAITIYFVFKKVSKTKAIVRSHCCAFKVVLEKNKTRSPLRVHAMLCCEPVSNINFCAVH